jgi:AbrB family looped-hinge helix DNA binding protein
MKTTMDSAGRLVIPKEIRRSAGLESGMALEVNVRDGVVEITPALIPVRLERRGRFLVAVAPEPIEPLTEEVVEQTLEQLRRERSS